MVLTPDDAPVTFRLVDISPKSLLCIKHDAASNFQSAAWRGANRDGTATFRQVHDREHLLQNRRTFLNARIALFAWRAARDAEARVAR